MTPYEAACRAKWEYMLTLPKGSYERERAEWELGELMHDGVPAEPERVDPKMLAAEGREER